MIITSADFRRGPAGAGPQANHLQHDAGEAAADAADDAAPQVVVHVRRGLPAPVRSPALATALEAGARGGLVLGTSLALGYSLKAVVQGGLGMVDRHRREATLAVSSVGVGLSFLGMAPGVDVAVQGLQGLAGGAFSARTVRMLQAAGKAGALAASLAPALEALWGEDELGRTLGTVVLANNAAQVVTALTVELLTGPVLGRGWMPTTLRDARGRALQPGTAAFARQLTGSGALARLLALAVPSVLLHAGLATGGNALMAPLAHAMGGPAAEELRFGQSSFGDHVIANGSVGLMVAAVETLRYFGTTLLQAGAHRLWGARLEPAGAAAPDLGAPAQDMAQPAQEVAGNRLGLSEDACLRLFIYASFLNLTVAALVTGPQSRFVRWLADDDAIESRLAVAQWLSLAANLMIATSDALVPMATHHRRLRPARVDPEPQVELHHLVPPAGQQEPVPVQAPAPAVEPARQADLLDLLGVQASAPPSRRASVSVLPPGRAGDLEGAQDEPADERLFPLEPFPISLHPEMNHAQDRVERVSALPGWLRGLFRRA